MAKTVLTFAFYALGGAAILIGLSNWLLGPSATADFFLRLILWVNRDITTPAASLAAADVDSEMRFYAVFWIGYGALLCDAATNLPTRMQHVPWLLSAFFLGGVGRLLSIFAVGFSSALFTVLMVIELGLPLALFAIWLLARRS